MNTIIYKIEKTLDLELETTTEIDNWNIYDLLMENTEFLRTRYYFTQFKLDWANIEIKYQCAKAINNGSPFYAFSIMDRTGLIKDNGNITMKDITAYGTFKKSLSDKAGYATTNQLIVPTTIYEKGQWIDTSIFGVKTIYDNDKLKPLLIPRYKSVYWQFNPTIISGAFLLDKKDMNIYYGTKILTAEIAITFRKRRQSINN